MFKTILLIGVGGGLGSILRYLISFTFNKSGEIGFPLATFMANLIGSLLIGILIGLFEKEFINDDSLKYLLITGFCGGFTTFSTFSSEGLQLFQSGSILLALIYIILSVVLGLLLVWLGMFLIK